MTAARLEPPIFLLAMPQVQDPFFRQSVVLLLAHTEEGSFGFIVNRPTGIKLPEILLGMGIGWQGEPEAEAYLGGPVQPETGTVLFGEPHVAKIAVEHEILPGVHLSQHLGDLEALAGEPPARFRLLLGYAGWGAGQLEAEIRRNDWLTAPADPALVFALDPEESWERALASVGVDPASLPAWTEPDDGGAAN
ncbi:MAG TPA: YqgE/AlgH family protein [Thermoanaerobaculia bacterium]|nr:YqgE/AlgH family protein [Thermoanaerobaculia bacterium]